MAAPKHLPPGGEPTAGDGPAGTRDLSAFWWLAFLGAALVLGASIAAVSAYWLRSEQHLIQAHVEAVSASLAGEMANRTEAVRAQLERWRRDAGVQAALADARPAVLAVKQAELAALIPGALGVNLFTPAMLAPGGGGTDTLSYAGTELVKAALTSGEVSPLEAHRLAQADAHLAIAAPVASDDNRRILGVMHVRLPLAMLPAQAPTDRVGPRYLFQQQAGAEMVTIRLHDDDDLPPPGAPVYRGPIAHTRLLLSAWVPPRGLLDPALLGWLIGILAAGLGGLGLVMWSTQRGQRRAVCADLDSLCAIMDDAQEHHPLRAPRVRLRQFLAANERLRRLLRELQPVRTVQPRPAADLAALAEAAAGPPDDAAPDSGFDLELDHPTPEPPAGEALGTQRPATPSAREGAAPPPVPTAIFRAYDVRGRLGSELTDAVMDTLGLALGSEALARASDTVVVGRDQRPSSEGLCKALVGGLLRTGVTVVDLGLVPTPLVYFSCHARGTASGAIVTGSHNPPEYNGLKVVLAGLSATGEDIAGLYQRIVAREFASGDGRYRPERVVDAYCEALEQDLAIARELKVVLDCGNATASLVAPDLLRALGCEVIELDCDCDGELADRHMPDPAQPGKLYNLIDAVRSAGADIGFGFDADGDRLGVIDSQGKFISADRVLMLLAGDVLARLPGSDILFDVKCSHRLAAEVLRQGGRPVMWKSGHSPLKAKLRELGAPLGGELSGHIMFADRWNGFDDALYAAARVLEVLALDPRDSHEVFDALPVGIGTPELFVALPAAEADAVISAVLAMADRLDGVEVNTIDGLRAEFDQGWGLVRASNTQDGLMFRFEADDQTSLDRIQTLFRRMLEMVAPQVALPF